MGKAFFQFPKPDNEHSRLQTWLHNIWVRITSFWLRIATFEKTIPIRAMIIFAFRHDDMEADVVVAVVQVVRIDIRFQLIVLSSLNDRTLTCQR